MHGWPDDLRFVLESWSPKGSQPSTEYINLTQVIASSVYEGQWTVRKFVKHKSKPCFPQGYLQQTVRAILGTLSAGGSQVDKAVDFGR